MIINHIGLSGGKDSTALWGWAINESGYDPASIIGSFCDTGNEYDEVYEQIAKLDAYGRARGIAPVRTLRANDPRWTWTRHPLFLALAIFKKRFPSARVRFCTQELKIKPTQKFIEELQLGGHEIVAHSGVRASESLERSLMQEWSDGQFNCRIRRPLLKWTIADVWDAHRRHGLPINKLYFTGRKRVGCRLCCMSNKRDVRIAAKRNPEVISLYRGWEKLVGATSARFRGTSGFFRATTVPPHLRSVKGLTRQTNGARGKKGSLFDACTIDDVVKWSMTLRGGKQLGLDFMFEEEDFNIDDTHAPCASGYCE